MSGQASFFAAFIIFAALLLAYVVMNESLKGKRKKEVVNSTSDFVREASTTGRLLDEGESIPIPSIVEETTDLLLVGLRTRKL